MRFLGRETIASAALVAATIALAGAVLSERLEHLLGAEGEGSSRAVAFAAASDGALAILLLFLLILIARETVARNLRGLRGLGALARPDRPAPDPGPAPVNLGRLNRRGKEKSLFARAFADALSDHREIERRLSLIIDNIGEGIITIDDRGYIGSFNPACETIFGWAAEAVIGQNIKILMPEDHARAHDGYLRRYLKTGQKHFDWSGRIERARRADGSVFPIELTVTQIAISDRLIYVGIVRDIGAREAAETAKSEFLATVSHELRTPLTSIRGAIGVLRAGVVRDDPAKVQRLLDVAQQNSERLGRLIDSILDMEKLGAGKLRLTKETLDVCRLVSDALEAFDGYAQQCGVTYEASGRCHNVLVSGDRERLMQVMANLLSNAAKFSPEGGVVRVSGRYDAGAGRVRLEVRDNGCGIPEEAQATVFDKFTQADNSDRRAHQGTGLGLSIARKIVELHGGRIGFDSQPGIGTMFFVELPATTAAPPAETAGRAPATSR